MSLKDNLTQCFSLGWISNFETDLTGNIMYKTQRVQKRFLKWMIQFVGEEKKLFKNKLWVFNCGIGRVYREKVSDEKKFLNGLLT